MANFKDGDCVRVRGGPGGTIPQNPHLVGMEGSYVGAVPISVSAGGDLQTALEIWYLIQLADGLREFVHSDFVEAC